jgi:hypothetical protein
MGWIKRNLFFAIGGVLALGLLGAAAYYIYAGWSHNSTANSKLNDVYGQLQNFAQQNPAPGNEKVDNTKIANTQEKELRAWETKAAKHFESIDAIPPGTNILSAAFADAFRHTIDQLQHEADSADVQLPPKYDFSFSAQRSLVKFAPGSLDLLAQQLGEVKVISEILFSARINTLDGIQRVRVSDDDIAGPQSDYIDERPTTNDLAIITPYVITFRCFTPELAKVVAGFATATNAFVIKYVNTQSGSAVVGSVGPPPEGMNGQPQPRMGEFPNQQPPPGVPPMGMPPMGAITSPGGLPTVLKEQLIRVTLEIELIKLLPKK